MERWLNLSGTRHLKWSMVQLREIFSRFSEALKEAEKMYAADISLKEKNEIKMKKENTD